MSLSYYILLNTKGKSVQDHPVIKKLIAIKTSLEKLKPLDKKLQPEIMQILRNIESMINLINKLIMKLEGKDLEHDNKKVKNTNQKNLLETKNKKGNKKGDQNLFEEEQKLNKNKKNGKNKEDKLVHQKENLKIQEKINKKQAILEEREKKNAPKDVLGKRNRNELQSIIKTFSLF